MIRAEAPRRQREPPRPLHQCEQAGCDRTSENYEGRFRNITSQILPTLCNPCWMKQRRAELRRRQQNG